MAGPITWRSVQQDNSGANRLLAGAASGIGNATNSLLGTFAQVQKQQEAADKFNIEKNTQDYLDKIGDLTGGDPNKLADPTVQANLDTIRKSYAPGTLDREAARNAVPQLLAQAQKTAENTINFNNIKTTEEQKPIQDELSAAIRNRDRLKVNSLLDSNQLPNEDKISATLDQFVDNDTKRADEAVNQANRVTGFNTSQAQAALSMKATRQSIDFAKQDQDEQNIKFGDYKVDRQDNKIMQQAKGLTSAADALAKAQSDEDNRLGKTNAFVSPNKDETFESTNKLISKGITNGDYDSAGLFTNDTEDRQILQNKVNEYQDPNKGISFLDEKGTKWSAPATPAIIQQALDASANEAKLVGGSAADHLDAYFRRALNDPTSSMRAQIIDAQKAIQRKAEVTEAVNKLKGKAGALMQNLSGATKTDPNIMRKIQKYGKPDADEDIDDSKSPF